MGVHHFVLSVAVLTATVVLADETPDESEAIEKIEALGGTVTRDKKLPGSPVIQVSLLKSAGFNDKHLHLLKGFLQLTVLDLRETQITDVGMKEVGTFTNLTGLYFYGAEITDIGLREIRGLKNLTSLGLTNCTKITDHGMQEVGQLTNLKMLNLANTKITDVGLKKLRELENLKSLGLMGCNGTTEEGVKELQVSLPSLTEVNFNRLPQGNRRRQATDVGEKELKEALPNPGGEPDEATAIAKLELLGATVSRSDTLEGRPVKGVSFRRGNKFDDKYVPLLRSFPHLTTLNLIGSPITDASLKEIGQLKTLTTLRLSWTGITGAGLTELRELKNLRLLGLTGCDGITEAGVNELQESLRNTKIIR